MADTETTEPVDWAELGRSSSSLLGEMSVEFMRTNRYSESQKCMFVVCRSRYVDDFDYTVVIYRRLGLNSPDMTHDTQEEL